MGYDFYGLASIVFSKRYTHQVKMDDPCLIKNALLCQNDSWSYFCRYAVSTLKGFAALLFWSEIPIRFDGRNMSSKSDTARGH